MRSLDKPPAILSSMSFIYLYLFVDMGKCQHFIDLCHLSIYLSIYLTSGKLWEDVPGGNLLKILSTLTPSLLVGNCQQLSNWLWKNVSIYFIYLSFWYWGNCGRTYQEGTSQQHWFYFISVSIYLYDIGKNVGGRTRREPPKDIVIDSISTTQLPIYLTLGKSREDVPGGNLPRYLLSVSFIYLNLFDDMGKCQRALSRLRT